MEVVKKGKVVNLNILLFFIKALTRNIIRDLI